MKEKVDYTIGVEENNAPYFSLDANGNPTGFYADLVEAIAEKQGFTYQFENMTATEAAAGEGVSCDFFLGTLKEKEKQQSEMFYQSKLCVVTQQGNKGKKLKNLENQSIAARASTGENDFAEYLAVKYDADSILFQTLDSTLEDMKEGYSFAAVLDAGNASTLLQQDQTLQMVKTSEKYFNEHRFTALKKDGIAKQISEGLAQIQADGTLQTFVEKYGL